LAARVTQSEPTSIDVQGSESDGIPERPRTPRTASRVSSFNKSFSVESGEGGENGSPFLNQFTTVGKCYGKSLAHPTSPTKTLGPLPVSAPLESEDHSIVTRPPLQAPASPTAAKREPKTPVAAGVGADSSPRGIAGGVDTKVAILPSNPSPSRGLRSSKRLREDGGRVKELSGNDNMPSKRRKA
jgi:hypothetical protein